ncbi:MAG: hypothetical protein ACM31C_22540 [Acidobacteriota bacterium]
MVDTQKGGDRPRFRQDLVAELIEDGGKRFIDVADPDSGSVFRFYEVEYSLACAMDGERDVAGIVRWAQEDLGLHTNPNEVRSVMATLGELGFLDTAAAARAAAQPVEAPRTVTPSALKPPANRWDQPTAMGEADDYLGKGVIHASGAAAKSPPADDVELGHAGGMRAAASDLPKAPDLELGAPGAVKPPPEKTVGTQEIPLGSPGRPPEMSVDLSADMAVRPDDVKEAVRQSQVIRAPSVPQELLDSVAPVVSDKETPPAKAEAKPAPEAPKPAPEKRPEPRVEAKAKPPVEHVPAKAPPAPAPRVNPLLLILLVLVVIGAGAFAVWKLILQKSNDTDKQSMQQPQPPPPPPAPPPTPPVESEKLASEQPPPDELKAPGPGTLDMIAANDSELKAGAVIASLVGHKPIETEIANLTKDIDKRQAEIAQVEKDRDAAEAAGNKPGVTADEKKLEEHKKALEAAQTKLAAKTADLAKLVVKAPSDGKLTAVAKANARVTANEVVAKLTPPPVLVTTFKLTSQPVTADARVLLAVRGSEQKLSCKVVAVDNGTKIACPHDAAPEGTEVTFAGIDTSAPKEEEIDMGSAAESGSGSAEPKKTEKAPAKAPAPAPVRRPMPRPTPKPPTPAVDKNAGSAAAPANKPAGGDQPAGSAAP